MPKPNPQTKEQTPDISGDGRYLGHLQPAQGTTPPKILQAFGAKVVQGAAWLAVFEGDVDGLQGHDQKEGARLEGRDVQREPRTGGERRRVFDWIGRANERSRRFFTSAITSTFNCRGRSEV